MGVPLSWSDEDKTGFAVCPLAVASLNGDDELNGFKNLLNLTSLWYLMEGKTAGNFFRSRVLHQLMRCASDWPCSGLIVHGSAWHPSKSQCQRHAQINPELVQFGAGTPRICCNVRRNTHTSMWDYMADLGLGKSDVVIPQRTAKLQRRAEGEREQVEDKD